MAPTSSSSSPALSTAPEPGEATKPERLGPLAVFLTLLVVVGPFIGAVVALTTLWGSHVGWFHVALLAGMYVITVLGLSAGYHRLFTHNSYVARRPLKIALAVAGSFALEGSVTSWVGNHRVHHRCSDRSGDPHSPVVGARSRMRGLLHAHMGWLFRPGPEVRRRDVADLLVDRDIVVVSKMFPLFAFLTFAVPFALGWLVTHSWWGAIMGLVWGGLARVFLAHHVTWSVNSLCHVFGRRPFETGDRSANVAPLALLSLGEAWHNAHHAFPTSARHGVERFQLDITARCIRVWEQLGWAHSARWLRAEQLDRRRTG